MTNASFPGVWGVLIIMAYAERLRPKELYVFFFINLLCLYCWSKWNPDFSLHSVKHCNFTPDFSNYLCFQINFRFSLSCAITTNIEMPIACGKGPFRFRPDSMFILMHFFQMKLSWQVLSQSFVLPRQQNSSHCNLCQEREKTYSCRLKFKLG